MIGYFVLKDNLLPCNERLGLAKYSEMFKTKTKTRESLEFLETIFSIIDKGIKIKLYSF